MTQAEAAPKYAFTCVACRDETPTDALTIALPNAPKTISPIASRKRDSEEWKSATRRRRKAPVRAANVAPAAWPRAAKCETGLRNATRKAPTATPIQAG